MGGVGVLGFSIYLHPIPFCGAIRGFAGARERTRTFTPLRETDFKSVASAIPPPGLFIVVIIPRCNRIKHFSTQINIVTLTNLMRLVRVIKS